jgi:pyrimidine 5'-nucleotidase
MKYVSLDTALVRTNMEVVVVLDIDNTLYRETPEILRGRLEAIKDFSRELGMGRDEFLRMCIGYEEKYNSIIKGLCLHHTISPEAMKKVASCKQDLRGLVAPDARLRELLETSPCPIYCLTNGNLEHSMDALKTLGLLRSIDGLFCADYSLLDIVVKPDLRSFRYVVDRLEIEDETKVIFFDDSTKNIEAALQAGWIGVHVDHTVPLAELLERKLDEHIIFGVAGREDRPGPVLDL